MNRTIAVPTEGPMVYTAESITPNPPLDVIAQYLFHIIQYLPPSSRQRIEHHPSLALHRYPWGSADHLYEIEIMGEWVHELAANQNVIAPPIEGFSSIYRMGSPVKTTRDGLPVLSMTIHGASVHADAHRHVLGEGELVTNPSELAIETMALFRYALIKAKMMNLQLRGNAAATVSLSTSDQQSCCIRITTQLAALCNPHFFIDTRYLIVSETSKSDDAITIKGQLHQDEAPPFHPGNPTPDHAFEMTNLNPQESSQTGNT